MAAPTQQDHALAARGARVSDFIASDDWRAARRAAEAVVLQEWKNAKTQEARETAHARFLAFDYIADIFAAMVQDGVVAQDTIKRAREE